MSIKKRTIRIIILSILIAALIIAVPIMAVFCRRKNDPYAQAEMQSVTVWQIDGFEGGKGSRAQYLQNAANACFKKKKTYFTVISLSADAARQNIENNQLPDVISYPAGFYGIDQFINKRDFICKTWCNGGYCLLTLDENADFNDVMAENTVINAGKDNLTDVASVLCGIGGAPAEQPTNAYLKLISGKCKYLFGTQRDVFRLKTRNVAFKIKPVEEFNDLYQNISILTFDNQKYAACKTYTDYLLNLNGVGKLGLFNDGAKLEYNELLPMQNISFKHILNYPCSQNYVEELHAAAKNADVNKIKNLLK